MHCDFSAFYPFPFMLFIYFMIAMYYTLNGMNKLKLNYTGGGWPKWST